MFSWLTSLCIIGSSFIHFIRPDSNAFFLIAEYYPIVYMYHRFLIHLSADGHVGCFHVLTIVNSAAVNIGVHVSLSILVSSGCMRSSGIAGWYGSSQRRQWHPTPVLLPGKSHGWRSLVGCSPWGRWESDTTERLHFHFSLSCIGEGNGNPL